MAKNSFLFIIFLFVNTYSLYSQILSPFFNDSVIAGNDLIFKFKTKANSLQYLEFSFDKQNWVEIGKFSNRNEFIWLPPFVDIDTIYFRYESHNFSLPEKIGSIVNGHSSEISTIDYNPEDSVFLSSSFDGKLLTWSLNSFNKLDSFTHTNRILSARFFFTSRKVIFSSDTSVYFLDFSKPLLPFRFGSSSGLIRAIAVSYKKRNCAFGSYSGDLVVFDSSLNELLRIPTGRQIYSIAFSNSGDLLAVGDYDGLVSIFDVSKGQLLYEFSTNRDSSFKNVVWSVSFSPNDSLVVAGGIDGKTRIYDIFKKQLLFSFPSHSFHIRGTAFCEFAPVITSVSLDSTVYQVLYQLNFPIHFPIKEESAITSLKFIDGGRFFLVGMRNGSISFYKNFEYEHLIQNLDLPYFVPVIAKCQSFQSNAGRLVSFSIILKNVHEIPLKRFNSNNSFAIINLPIEHFGIFHPETGNIKFGPKDTIWSNLRTIGFKDTFAVVQAYTLHPWGDRKGIFSIQKINFRDKKNIYWIMDTSSVEIVENCKPIEDLVKFELLPSINFDVVQDPYAKELKLRIFSDNAIFCKFALINSINGMYHGLFEGEIQQGETELSFNTGNFSSGAYFLTFDLNFMRLAKKLIILK